MTHVYLALYKGKRTIKTPFDYAKRVADFAVRQITHSPYSHCEIAVRLPDNRFECYTASLSDGGVRKKIMALSPDKWDFIAIDDPAIVVRTEKLFAQTNGAKYDFLGALGVVLPVSGSLKRWFCSEWCAAVLELDNPAQYSPNDLAKILIK